MLGLLAACEPDGPATRSIMTVNGPISIEEMGVTLSHEHVLVDFAGAELASPDRYDSDSVFRTVLPYLRGARERGARTLIDATPQYLGRDPLLLQRLADASGLHLLVSTGYYGALEDRYLPPHAFTDPADSLAARWIREWEKGIDGTDIRPGFIKIGVDPGPLSDVDRKLIEAAARTHLRTGLTIAAHTGLAGPALEQLAVLDVEGVDRSAWIWVHAHAEADSKVVVHAARTGAWISLDGLGPDNVTRYVERLTYLKAEELLGRVLISHDAGWYHVGEPGGGTFRAYETLFAELLPALEVAGFTADEIRRLTVVNPAEAFTVRVRATSR
jgi:phosphotriesterase-related protein